MPVSIFLLAELYIAKDDSVTVSCDACTQSAEGAADELLTIHLKIGV